VGEGEVGSPGPPWRPRSPLWFWPASLTPRSARLGVSGSAPQLRLWQAPGPSVGLLLSFEAPLLPPPGLLRLRHALLGGRGTLPRCLWRRGAGVRDCVFVAGVSLTAAASGGRLFAPFACPFTISCSYAITLCATLSSRGASGSREVEEYSSICPHAAFAVPFFCLEEIYGPPHPPRSPGMATSSRCQG